MPFGRQLHFRASDRTLKAVLREAERRRTAGYGIHGSSPAQIVREGTELLLGLNPSPVASQPRSADND